MHRPIQFSRTYQEPPQYSPRWLLSYLAVSAVLCLAVFELCSTAL